MNDRSRSAMKAFQDRLSGVRQQLRVTNVPGMPLLSKQEIDSLHRGVVIALEEFGPQDPASRGHAWAILAGSAAKHLAHAAEIHEAEAARSELAEAQQKIAIVLGDINA